MIPVGKTAMNKGRLKIKQNAVESNLGDDTLKTHKEMLECILYYPYTSVFKKIQTSAGTSLKYFHFQIAMHPKT